MASSRSGRRWTGIAVEGTGAIPAPVGSPRVRAGARRPKAGSSASRAASRQDRPSRRAATSPSTIETSNGTHACGSWPTRRAGSASASFAKGARYRIVGIAGQRATKKGELDGYRVWVRDREDVDAPAAGAHARFASGARPAAPADARPAVGLDRDRAADDRPGRRDRGRRDAPAPACSTARAGGSWSRTRRVRSRSCSQGRPGARASATRIRATGRVGQAYGAPRLRADVDRAARFAAAPAPLRVQGPLTDAHTWRLVTISGPRRRRHASSANVGAPRSPSVRRGWSSSGSRARGSRTRRSPRAASPTSSGSSGPPTRARPTSARRSCRVRRRRPADRRRGRRSKPARAPAGALVGRTAPTGARRCASPTKRALDADLVDLETLLGRPCASAGSSSTCDPTASRSMMARPPAGSCSTGDAAATRRPGRARRRRSTSTGRVERARRRLAASSSTIRQRSSSAAPSTARRRCDAVSRRLRLRARRPTSDDVAAGRHRSTRLLPGAGAGLAGLLAISLASVGRDRPRRRHGRTLCSRPAWPTRLAA